MEQRFTPKVLKINNKRKKEKKKKEGLLNGEQWGEKEKEEKGHEQLYVNKDEAQIKQTTKAPDFTCWDGHNKMRMVL